MDWVLINIMFQTLICFIIGITGLPHHFFRLSLDLRLYVGLFSVCTYLGGQSLSVLSTDVNSTTFILLITASILVVSVAAYLLAILFYISMGRLQQSFLFYAWYMGLLCLFYGLEFYLFTFAFLMLGVISIITVVLLRKYHLLSVVRTIEIKSENFDDIEKVKSILTEFKADIFSQKLTRSNGYVFVCKYRIPILAQHIFSRYLFKSDTFMDINLNETD